MSVHISTYDMCQKKFKVVGTREHLPVPKLFNFSKMMGQNSWITIVACNQQ